MTRTLLALLPILLLAACAGTRTDTAAPTASTTDAATLDRNHGYALLYSTISDECAVDRVLIIKRPAAPVADAIKRIGEFSRTTKTALENLAKEDPPIALQDPGLPAAESRTREAIDSATSKQIIFHGGKDLEFRLLLTQHEALNYIHYLATTLETMEPRDNRKRHLAQIAKESETLHDQVLALMKTPYTGATK
jgi:hypothetical protein